MPNVIYETMVFRETADKDPSDIVREFALSWQPVRKVTITHISPTTATVGTR